MKNCAQVPRSEEPFRDSLLREIDTGELKKRYANACITYKQCGGHNKAARNKTKMEEYAAELTLRGINLNDITEGEFNGAGSC